MTFCIMLSLLVIKTDSVTNYIKINEIQAIEMIDKGSNDGGIIMITLKGDKEEQIVQSELDEEKWIEAKQWLDTHTINLAQEMSKTDLKRQRDESNQF